MDIKNKYTYITENTTSDFVTFIQLLYFIHIPSKQIVRNWVKIAFFSRKGKFIKVSWSSKLNVSVCRIYIEIAVLGIHSIHKYSEYPVLVGLLPATICAGSE